MIRSTRNVKIAGCRTSFRLETPFWDAAHDCARLHGLTIHQFITRAVQHNRDPKATMSSTIRVYLITHYREQSLAAAVINRRAA